MDGGKAMAPNYPALMANASFLPEEEPGPAEKNLKVRLSEELLESLRRIAAVETAIKRHKRKNAGKTSLNKLLQAATEMFVAGWIEDWGSLPPSSKKEDVDRIALAVSDRRAARARTESAQRHKK